MVECRLEVLRLAGALCLCQSALLVLAGSRAAGVAPPPAGEPHAAARGAQVYEEGTHLMVPWFEWPYIFDVRARPNVIQSTSGSKDLQMARPRPATCCGSPGPGRRYAASAALVRPALQLSLRARRAGEHRPACADAAHARQAAGDIPLPGHGLC